jgi:hypothetical protein
MSQLEAYQRALDAFPELPKPTPGCQYLSQLLPSEQIRQTFQNLNTPLDLRMKIGTVSLLLIPVDQLQHHKNQRELDETHARSICDSFGQNPATHMTTNPGIAIVDNPEIFPALTSSESVWKLTDRSVTFTVLAGQHRVEALKYFAQKYGIETKNVFWVFKILHPCASTL